jgi:glutamine synthetase
VSRDILATGLVRAENELPGVGVVLHVHDEIVAESRRETAPAALDALEADSVLTQAVGADLVANFIAIKREELNNLAARDEAGVIAYYLPYI